MLTSMTSPTSHPKPKPTVVGVYVRTAIDPRDRMRHRAVMAQLAKCETYMAETFPNVSVLHFMDEGPSSIDPRPGYAALCEAATAGRINAVVTTDADRLTRSVVEWERFAALCRDAGVSVHVVDSRTVIAAVAGR